MYDELTLTVMTQTSSTSLYLSFVIITYFRRIYHISEYSSPMPSNITSKTKRRRHAPSDWVVNLQQFRSARNLRRQSEPCFQRQTSPVALSNSHIVGPDSVLSTEYDDVKDVDEQMDEDRSRKYAESLENIERTEDQENSSHGMYTLCNEKNNANHTTSPSISTPVLEDTSDEDSFNSAEEQQFQQFDEECLEGEGEEDMLEMVQPTDNNSTCQDPSQIASGCNPTIGTTVSADLSELNSIRSIWNGELNLTAIVAVVGSVRFTVKQYGLMRDLMNEKSNCDEMPSYSRTRRFFQTLVKSVFPKSVMVYLPKKRALSISMGSGVQSDADSEISTQSERICMTGSSHEQGMRTGASIRNSNSEIVRVVLPSSWAKVDVATASIFSAMFPNFTNPEAKTFSPLERSNIVQDRESVTGSTKHLFARSGNDQQPCHPGTKVSISAIGSPPDCTSSVAFVCADGTFNFQGTITATWCVGCLGSSNASTERALSRSLNGAHSEIVKHLSTAKSPREDEPDEPDHVFPGDICSILKTAGEDESGCIPVLVHRFWRYEDGIPSAMVLWLCVNAENSVSEVMSGHLPLHAKHDILNIDIVSSSPRNASNSDTESHGKLRDGGKFVIYRVLLYCDDFQKSSQMNSKGSAGGCYFLPMSLPPEFRRSTSAVRIISLTPPSVSTNEVLRFVADDLVRSAIQGIEAYTPFGEPVRIFIDILGFIGDYPAASEAIDTIGHIGRAPCTLCSFRRLHHSEADGTRNGYTTDVHCNNSSFLRHGERHTSLRGSGIPDCDTTRLGMVLNSKVTDGDCPLLYLQRTLETKLAAMPLTEDGSPVHSGFFDAYRCNIIAPDHLLTGLAKNVLNVVYHFLPSTDLRTHFDISICAALRENGLLTQNKVFNTAKRKLNSMSLSELYCVLLVSVPVLSNILASFSPQRDVLEAVQLVKSLQKLVAFTYWWPESDVDGVSGEKLVRENCDVFFSELKDMSKNYVRAVEDFCRHFPASQKELDKPNLHRLIELYEHSVPAFGHAREFMELVFESAHQPLKRCIARSNNHDSHISAVEHCVGNDWQGRLASLYRDMTAPDGSETHLSAKRGIRRMLLGNQADLLDEDEHKTFIEETEKILHSQFSETLQKQLATQDRVANFCTHRMSKWETRSAISIRVLASSLGISQETLSNVVRLSEQWINAVYPPLATWEGQAQELRLFKGAKRVRISRRGRRLGKPGKFDGIKANCVVQVYLHRQKTDTRLLQSFSGANAKLCFFAILAVLHRKGDDPWAICQRCDVAGVALNIRQNISPHCSQLLRMTSDVRRVALYHMCHSEEEPRNACVFDIAKHRLRHSHSVLDNGKMSLQRRVNGYPPRMA